MIYRKLVWITINALAIILFLFVAIILALQHPVIQTKVVKIVTKSLSEEIDLPVDIEYVNLRWYDELYIKGIDIQDSRRENLISINKLTVNFDLSTLATRREVHIEKAKLEGARVALRNTSPDSTMNITFFIQKIKEILASGKPKNPRIFSIASVTLEASEFSLNNVKKDSLTDRWDFNHFHLEDIWADLTDLKINKDTFEINIDRLQCVDRQSKLAVNNLSAFYRICGKSMAIENMEANIGESAIKHDLLFSYGHIRDLSDFNHSVDLDINLQHAAVHTEDLAWFAPWFGRFDENFTLQGRFSGMVSRFSFEDFSLSFGNDSRLEGNLNITGLPRVQESFIDIDLDRSYVVANDCRPFLPAEIYDKLAQLEYLSVDGALTGFVNDFVANGNFITSLGVINSDINLKIDEDRTLSTYSGKLAVADFHLGRFLDDEKLFQKVDMTGEIEGKGLSMESADFKLKAAFNYLEVRNYQYTNIKTDARFAKELFIGNLSIADKNLKFNANALINLRENQKRVDLTGRLDTAYFQNLNLTQEDIVASADFDLDVTGLKADSILGELKLQNAYLSYNDREMSLKRLDVLSDATDSQRLLYVSSDLFSLSLKGNFNYTRLVRDLENQYREFLLAIKNDSEEIDAYYKKKKTLAADAEPYYVRYEATLTNINPLVQLFVPTGYVSQNTAIEGVAAGGFTHLSTFYSAIDTLSYKQYTLYDNLVDVKFSKNIDGSNIDATAQLNSRKQVVNQTPRIENFASNVVWKGKHLDFKVAFDQFNSENEALVNGKLDFLDTATRITLDSTQIKLLDKVWALAEGNETLIKNKSIEIRDFTLFNEEKSISISGGAAPDPSDETVAVRIRDFALEDINPVIKNDIFGSVNGTLFLRNIYDGIIVESELEVEDFMIKSFPVGDVNARSIWENQDKQLDVAIDVIRGGEKMIAISGNIDPASEEEQLHLYAYFDNANLNIAEPFIEQYFTQVDGTASGEFLILGTLSQPHLKGTGTIRGGRVKVNYLNTLYTFNGDLIFEENQIGVENLIVRDSEYNRADFSGGFFHSGLKNFVMDISGTLNNFKALNTSARDNDLYYGTAIVSGDINFLGAPSNLNISANAVTERGTRIFIPLDGGATVEQENFIQFITEADSLFSEAEEVDKIDLKGLKLDLDLEVTPEAYCELIFDIKAGDIIRGRGSGDIKLEIDTHGQFTMFGDLEIQEGGYNFTLYNVINKEFAIIPGSAISWTGDPYKAQMDIRATYEQMASLSPLLDSALWDNPEIRRKYPATVLLDLEGDLLSPEIDFDIEIENYPYVILLAEGGSHPLDADISAFKNRLRADEQELKRQVFSLMVLRRFSPENAFDVSGSVGKSVSEFISNQLSYWVTQFDENLEIDVDLGSLDQEAFNTFQLRLSYTLLDGRLRITRDGGFTNQQNQASFTAIAGDWTVEYNLTPNGKLRVKMYNKTNYNTFNPTLESQGATTAGFSLMHTESFDKIREIFNQARERGIQEKEEKEESEENANAPKAGALKKEEDVVPETMN